MHYLAVTKYDYTDPSLKPKASPAVKEIKQSKKLCNEQLKALYDAIPLKCDTLEFRVLDVLPGMRGTPIRCHLITAASVRKTEYEALSYVWGGEPAESEHEIIVNDCSFRVTVNLRNALESLRHAEENRRLWVDAICIDQSNETEKLTQLPMMGDIYRAAKCVCVYLGEADEESDFLLRVLEDHQDLQSPLGTKIQETANWATTLDYLSANEDRILRGLVCMMHRPWFERLWIYQVSKHNYHLCAALMARQEFHVATREPQIYIGSHSVSASVMFGSLFGFLTDVCSMSSVWTREMIEHINHYLSAEAARLGYSHNVVGFHELRRKVRLCGYAVHANDLMPRYPCFWLADPAIAAARCKMPEDKIYGLVGMFDPVSRDILQPVEDMEFKEVFMRTTAWCLLVDNAIFYTFFRYHLLLDDGYPSWTLSFDKPIPFDEIQNQLKVNQEKVFPDKDPIAKNCIVHQQVLYIEGIELSTIETVCTVPDEVNFEKLRRLWHFERHLASRKIAKECQADHVAAGGVQNQILYWTFGISGKLVSWLARNATFYELLLSERFPNFPETEAYPSSDAMQELLGGLLFDPGQLLHELHRACELATADLSAEQSTAASPSSYSRLSKALLGSDVVKNAKTLRVIYDALENLVPSIATEKQSGLYLSQHGYSTTDAHHNARKIVATVAAEGDEISEDQALAHAINFTYNHANLRDEYAQRLLNSTFISTTNGAAGLGPEGGCEYQKGDKIVFFREMPTAMAIRRCSDDEAYRLVGIVQMEGLLDGSIYERPEIKEGKPKLFEIR